MKAIVAITVISCFFILATHSIDLSCVTRFTSLASCLARLTTASQNSTVFCNDCGNSLVSYYQDCTGGLGVDTVQRGVFSTNFWLVIL